MKMCKRRDNRVYSSSEAATQTGTVFGQPVANMSLLCTWVLGKVEFPIRLIIVVKSKNCQAYSVCSLFSHPLRCPVDLALSSSWLAQQVTWPISCFQVALHFIEGAHGPN